MSGTGLLDQFAPSIAMSREIVRDELTLIVMREARGRVFDGNHCTTALKQGFRDETCLLCEPIVSLMTQLRRKLLWYFDGVLLANS